MKRFVATLGLCAFAVGACVADAAAQPAPQGAGAPQPQPNGQKPPYWGLFGGGSKDQPHSLDVNATVSGVYDDNLAAQLPGSPYGNGVPIDPRYAQAGFGYGFRGDAFYGFRKTGRRDSVKFDANAGVQEFSGALGDPIWMRNLGVNGQYRHDFTPKITMSASGGVSDAPYYQYAPFIQGTIAAPGPAGKDTGFATNAPNVMQTTGTFSVEDRFSKRSNISFAAFTDRQDAPDFRAVTLDRQSVRGTFTHNILKQLAVHVGYVYEKTDYSNSLAEPYVNQGLDIGLGYGDGITIRFGRYYTLSLAIGTSIARNGSVRYAEEGQPEYRFLVNGHATLDRSIGRTWNAYASFIQDTQHVLGFTQPIYSSTATAGASGPIANKLNFSGGAGASRGQQVFSTSTTGGSLVSYNASARLTYAIMSNLALYSQASYYKYSTPSDFYFPLFLPNLERRSISVGLSTWVPLIKPPRRARTNEPQETGQP